MILCKFPNKWKLPRLCSKITVESNPSETMWNLRMKSTGKARKTKTCENPIRGLSAPSHRESESQGTLDLPNCLEVGSIHFLAYRNQGRLKFCIHVASCSHLMKLLPFRKHFTSTCSPVWWCNFDLNQTQIAIKTLWLIQTSFLFTFRYC